MNVTVTGATGLIGTKLVAALKARGDTVTVLSRSPDRAQAALGVAAFGWDPTAGPAPAEALAGRDAVVHLAGEPVAQRWTKKAKEAIRSSRELGTRNLVAGLRAAEPRPHTLVSSSAVGYYGPHGDELVPESTPPGNDFLAGVCQAWEAEADKAAELGLRVAKIRTGVVLDASGGALKTMLPPFKAGAGGPVAGVDDERVLRRGYVQHEARQHLDPGRTRLVWQRQVAAADLENSKLGQVPAHGSLGHLDPYARERRDDVPLGP